MLGGYIMENFSASLFVESVLAKKDMIHIASFVADLFGTSYKKFYPIGIVDGKKIKASRKYSEDELEKFAEEQDYDIQAVSFQNIKKVDGWPDTTISIDFLNSSIRIRGVANQIMLEIDPKVTEENCFIQMDKLVTYIHSIGIKIWHGMATMMEERKFPMFFLIGINTPYMTDEERKITHAMSCYQADYQTKIWDIFEYNLVRKEIVSEKMMKSIKQVIGAERIREMDDFYIFALMDDPEQMSLASSKIVAKRNKLRKIFEKEDRIMFRA